MMVPMMWGCTEEWDDIEEELHSDSGGPQRMHKASLHQKPLRGRVQ